MKANDSKIPLADGEHIRRLRRKGNKTQKAIAVEFGLSTGTIANYENGRTKVPLSFWNAFIEAYGDDPVEVGPPEERTKLLPQSNSPSKVDGNRKPTLILDQVMKIRRKYIKIEKQVFSPIRRLINDMIFGLFVAATLVFVCETVLRFGLNAAEEPSHFRDVLFGLSFLVIFFLSLPTILSVPWGMKIKFDNES